MLTGQQKNMFLPTLALYRTLTRLPHRYYDVVGVDYKEYLLLVRSSSYRSENEK
jgi:hypothetical protein